MSGPKPLLDSTKLNLERVQFMLIDDNQQALDILGQVMAGLGVRNMVKCTSIADAKKHLSKTTFDFVVTDAQMPGEGGYDLLEWLRREPNHPNKYVPAVIVTAHSRASAGSARSVDTREFEGGRGDGVRGLRGLTSCRRGGRHRCELFDRLAQKTK